MKTGVVPDTKGDDALQDHVRATQSNVTTNTSNVMVQKSPEKPIAATVSLRGCNFTNWNIAFSGIFESGSGFSGDVDDSFEGIYTDELLMANWVHGIHDLV